MVQKELADCKKVTEKAEIKRENFYRGEWTRNDVPKTVCKLIKVIPNHGKI